MATLFPPQMIDRFQFLEGVFLRMIFGHVFAPSEPPVSTVFFPQRSRVGLSFRSIGSFPEPFLSLARPHLVLENVPCPLPFGAIGWMRTLAHPSFKDGGPPPLEFLGFLVFPRDSNRFETSFNGPFEGKERFL